MDEDERVSRALDSLTNRANTAEAEVQRLRDRLAFVERECEESWAARKAEVGLDTANALLRTAEARAERAEAKRDRDIKTLSDVNVDLYERARRAEAALADLRKDHAALIEAIESGDPDRIKVALDD